ncbi:hypothetical protein F4777DRAFT_558092 [Nemania sp. FL0916]|nr:hypothetical protein F4777DRAFT_558092 [Nemania sp. FL0916]
MGYLHLPLCVVLLLAGFAKSTTECRACIPLEDLVAHAHGISLSFHGISSAVSFHNGTVESTASLEPTARYIDLLERWRIDSAGGGLKDPWPDGLMSEPQQDGWLTSLATRLRTLWPETFGTETSLNISKDAEILCELFQTLQAQNTVPSMRNVGISVPIWTTDVQAQDIFAAATCANLSIRDMIHEAPATAASQGTDICRVPSDYLPCGSAHIMTLDLSKNVLVASFHAIYRGWYLWQPRRYSVYAHDGKMLGDIEADSMEYNDRMIREITDWINKFAEDRPVHSLYLIGQLANNSILREAAIRSQIGSQLTDLNRYTSDEVVSVGTAILAKERMESQDTDCTEPPQCEHIREEADRLTGNSHTEHAEL